MKAGSHINGETRHRALLATQKIRQSVMSWSESEQRIAVALIKFLATGESSKLLVRRIMHVIAEERPRAQLLHDETVSVSWVELDQYVGLRPEQQKLIEHCYDEVCASKVVAPIAIET